MAEPLVSVVIATYNRWPLVNEAVESALTQNSQGTVEVIVVDDGSTDGTTEKLAAAHPEVRLVVQENAERGAARNRGASEATGRFLSFLDADDRFEPWHVEQLREALVSSECSCPAPTVYSATARLWDPRTGRVRTLVSRAAGHSPRLYEAALLGTCLPLQGLFVPRERFWEVGAFPPERSIARSEDWVLLARLASRSRFEFLDRPSVRIREHPGRSMHASRQVIESRQAAMNLILAEGLPGRVLDQRSRALVVAGTHRLCAAHLYSEGDMHGARNHLRITFDQLGWTEGATLAGRLWLQTLLGPRMSRNLRRAKGALLDRSALVGKR